MDTAVGTPDPSDGRCPTCGHSMITPTPIGNYTPNIVTVDFTTRTVTPSTWTVTPPTVTFPGTVAWGGLGS